MGSMGKLGTISLLLTVLGIVGLMLMVPLGCDDDDDGGGPADGGDTETGTGTGTDTGPTDTEVTPTDNTDVTPTDTDDTGTETVDTQTEEIPTADEADKANICGCIANMFSGGQETPQWMEDQCVAEISDECVYCVNNVTGSAQCADLDVMKQFEAMGTCGTECGSDVLAAPEDTAQCLEVLDLYPDYGNKDDYAACMCAHCLDIYSECLADPGCVAILLCAVYKQCSGGDCMTPDTCQAVIAAATASVGLTQEVKACGDENACYIALPPMDGGTPDAGDAGE